MSDFSEHERRLIIERAKKEIEVKQFNKAVREEVERLRNKKKLDKTKDVGALRLEESKVLI